MRVSLSRKGFDSEFGSYSSPILIDNRMISLPIPSSEGDRRYDKLKLSPFKSMAELMEKCNIKSIPTCHLDPDLCKQYMKRDSRWHPLFGQIGGAQTHLEKQNFKEGDLFLFFGTFQKIDKKFKFFGNPKHVIFGYLQVEKILKVINNVKIPTWMQYHIHNDKSHREKKYQNNTIYVARKTLIEDESLPGAGLFRFNEQLVLTKEGETKSKWDPKKLPKNVVMSWTRNPWMGNYFKSTDKGQEFVIQDDKGWALNLIKNSEIWSSSIDTE